MHPAGATLIAHIEHIANIAGEDHVGIGTDNGVLPTQFDAATKQRMDDWQRQRIKLGIAAPGEGSVSIPMLPTTTASTATAASPRISGTAAGARRASRS